MASATTRTERSATVRQQIVGYLWLSDLESIKQIAETDKDYFPKDFIAQCLKHFRYNYENDDDDWQESGRLVLWRLFVDAFTWFVEEFGPTSPGYYGLGKSKEDIIDPRDNYSEVLGEAFHAIMNRSNFDFQNLSLVVAKSLIESFGEEELI